MLKPGNWEYHKRLRPVCQGRLREAEWPTRCFAVQDWMDYTSGRAGREDAKFTG